MNNLDWQDLAYFIAVVEQQTLTAAAEVLEVQHSTVSRRIERLEQTLGVGLFDRMGKRYTLTEEGQLLYTQAVEVQAEVLIFRRMAIDHNAMQGNVVISAPPVLANEMLMPALPAFRQRYPDIILHLLGETHLSNLHRKEADIAIRLRRPTQEDLMIRTLTQIKYGFFAHEHYLHHTPVEVRQFIEFYGNSRLNGWLQAVQQLNPRKIAFCSNDLYMIYQAVLQQVGIGILPYFVLQKPLLSATFARDKLIPINPVTTEPLTSTELNEQSELSEPMTLTKKGQTTTATAIKTDTQTPITITQSAPVYMVMHPDVRRSARVRAVADWLVEVLAD